MAFQFALSANEGSQTRIFLIAAYMVTLSLIPWFSQQGNHTQGSARALFATAPKVVSRQLPLTYEDPSLFAIGSHRLPPYSFHSRIDSMRKKLWPLAQQFKDYGWFIVPFGRRWIS